MSIRQAEKVPSGALGVSIPSWSCLAAHACIFAQKRAAQNQAAQHFLSLAPGSGQLMAVWDERLRQAESKKHFLLWGVPKGRRGHTTSESISAHLFSCLGSFSSVPYRLCLRQVPQGVSQSLHTSPQAFLMGKLCS